MPAAEQWALERASARSSGVVPAASLSGILAVVGSFGELSYSDGEWRAGSPTADTYLRIEIYDSDIATVDFRPTYGGGGRFFLGCEPRIYFEDEAANTPVHRAEEAAAFSSWIAGVTGVEVDAGSIERLMATTDPEDEPTDVFVEETVQRLIEVAGLPTPRQLSG